MITECTHGMPSPKSCVDCMYEGPVEPPPKPPVVKYHFTSQFRSLCWKCKAVIEEGDRMARVEKDGIEIYWCTTCAPEGEVTVIG